MKQYWWVKFENQPPTRHCYETFEEFWYNIREAMLKHQSLKLEWIIGD